jgi:hypothetical protein
VKNSLNLWQALFEEVARAERPVFSSSIQQCEMQHAGGVSKYKKKKMKNA